MEIRKYIDFVNEPSVYVIVCIDFNSKNTDYNKANQIMSELSFFDYVPTSQNADLTHNTFIGKFLSQVDLNDLKEGILKKMEIEKIEVKSILGAKLEEWFLIQTNKKNTYE